jgi:hypothetical protein
VLCNAGIGLGLKSNSILLACVEALISDKPVVSSDSLCLPEGISWLGLESPVVYVRSFYEDYLTSVLCNFDASLAGFRIFITCGTAGIGKSAFGMWLLGRAIALNRTVIYQHEKTGVGVVIQGATKVVRSFNAPCREAEVPELEDPSAGESVVGA